MIFILSLFPPLISAREISFFLFVLKSAHCHICWESYKEVSVRGKHMSEKWQFLSFYSSPHRIYEGFFSLSRSMAAFLFFGQLNRVITEEIRSKIEVYRKIVASRFVHHYFMIYWRRKMSCNYSVNFFISIIFL